MHARRVLVIDDDVGIVQLIKDIFTAAGATVDAALDPEKGLRLFRTQRYDLVILDVMMPEIDGWQVCESLRELSGVPIIMLTVLGSDREVVRGLKAGADDYVVKPFSPKVLLARARALLRRADLSPDRQRTLTYRDDHLAFDLARRQVWVRGRPVTLTRTEYHLFECLARNADHLLTFRQILEWVWGRQYVDSIEYVHVYIHRLRQKLEPEPQNPRYLLNMPGAGYLFCIPGSGDTPS
ncbi:MAG: response regulator [Anaerolineae bacterium]|nr:response regulator [Anaerolineae bacterium]